MNREHETDGQFVQDDTHSDYHAVKAAATSAMHRGVWANRFPERFVACATREMRSDLPRRAIDHISEGKHFISYRGLPMAKDPFDLVLYEMLLYELQPATVIELGAYTGASALWMADRLSTFGISARVLSVDIDLSLVEQLPREHAGIEFLEGDCNQIDQLFSAEWLRQLPHPLVLIDDAHVNIEGVYGHFHQNAFQPGDYLIIEDTIPWIPGTFGPVPAGEPGAESPAAGPDKPMDQAGPDQAGPDQAAEWGDWKSREIETFLEQHAAEYRVDRYYTDFFGYNGTWNWNGFVKRV